MADTIVGGPKVKESYLRKLKKIQKEPLVHTGTLKEFGKRYNIH